MNRARGFTLLEVMIATMILAVLSMFTTQSVRTAIAQKAKIQGDLERNARFNDALTIIERDINLAFHSRDITREVIDAAKKEATTPTPPNNPPGTPAPPVPPPPNPALVDPNSPPAKNLTQFLGYSDNFHFTSLNHVRTQADAQESDQEEVGFFVRSCKAHGAADVNVPCLWRRSSPVIDDKVNEGGVEMVLLENVTEFKLRYFGEGRDDWINEWKTDESGDDKARNRFPQAVEIAITAKDLVPKSEKLSRMTLVVPLRFPNNPPLPKGTSP